jgi:hypothetical protein
MAKSKVSAMTAFDLPDFLAIFSFINFSYLFIEFPNKRGKFETEL